MKQGHITFRPEGRCGNFLFMAANAMAFAIDHQMPFHMPTTSRDPFWCPTYLKHLAAPDFDPSLPTITIQEKGYPFQKLPWEESWREGNIVFNGFFQSEKYWSHHRERVLEAFGFPWELRPGLVAVHARLGDARRHPTKHIILEPQWYFDQMAKFPGAKFLLFSDEPQWLKDTFGHRKDCVAPSGVIVDPRDPRQEIQDLVVASTCEHLIGSASTYAIWIGLLQRNENARRLFPKQWMNENWEGTTAKTWIDVVPEGWERA